MCPAQVNSDSDAHARYYTSSAWNVMGQVSCLYLTKRSLLSLTDCNAERGNQPNAERWEKDLGFTNARDVLLRNRPGL